jgi:hypothetical protein
LKTLGTAEGKFQLQVYLNDGGHDRAQNVVANETGYIDSAMFSGTGKTSYHPCTTPLDLSDGGWSAYNAECWEIGDDDIRTEEFASC